jgi:dolichol kinase
MSAVGNANAPTIDAVAAIALDLHAFVSHIQRPRLANSAWAQHARARAADLAERVATARTAIGRRKQAAGEAFARMAEGLHDFLEATAGSPTAVRMKKLGRRLAEDYEALRAELREFQREDGATDVVLPHVKPVTWARSAFHLAMGLSAIVLFHFVVTQAQAILIMGAVAFTALTLEITRRFSRRWNAFLFERVFGLVARPWERHRTNSATWYTFALLVLALLMPGAAAEVGLVVLALGDPAASLAGRRWGERKLWRDKTIVGTSAFAIVTAVAVFAFLALAAPAVPFGSRLGLTAVVTVSGAAAELFSESLDDNFTLPVLAAGIAALWLG